MLCTSLLQSYVLANPGLPILDSGCHVCFCKVAFVQTHGGCTHLWQGELQLSVKLLTYFSMLLVVYMLQLALTCSKCDATCSQVMLWMVQAHLPAPLQATVPKQLAFSSCNPTPKQGEVSHDSFQHETKS